MVDNLCGVFTTLLGSVRCSFSFAAWISSLTFQAEGLISLLLHHKCCRVTDGVMIVSAGDSSCMIYFSRNWGARGSFFQGWQLWILLPAIGPTKMVPDKFQIVSTSVSTHFADEGLYSQSYGFSSSHIRM